MAPENRILSLLPAEDDARIRPHFEIVSLFAGQHLYECGDPFRHVYFPLDAVIHLFSIMKSGATLEAGTIGAEGVAGFGVFLGAATAPCQAIVLNESRALRISAEIVKQEFGRGGYFQRLILQYINFSCNQLSQTAACNHRHRFENRLPRWLLLQYDRLKSNHLKVTQELIAQLLGRQRPAVSVELSRLEKKGIIRCRRGGIEILDRAELEDRSCECHEILRRELNLLRGKSALPAGIETAL